MKAAPAVSLSRRPAPPPRRRWWPLALAGCVLLAGMVIGHTVDLGPYVHTARTWTGALGVLAPAAYVAVYVAATLLGVPGVAFTLLAPLLFGLWPAVAVMIVASALSAAGGFLIARYLARDALRARLDGSPAFARLSRLLEANDWFVIPVLRIVPLAPFAVVNYGFGLTGIGFWRYEAWSVLAMVPMNVALILGAEAFYRAAVRGSVPWPLLAGAGIAALLLVALSAAGGRAFARS